MTTIMEYLALPFTLLIYVVETAMASLLYLLGQWWFWVAAITISAAAWTASRNGDAPGSDSLDQPTGGDRP